MSSPLRYLRKNRTAYLFILPLIVTIVVFLLYPVLRALVMSFQDWYMPKGSATHPFVGLDNYDRFVSDEYFLNSLKITVIYIVVTVLFRYVLGFATAMLLNAKIRFRGLVRSLIIIPWAVPEIVTCLVFRLMLNRDYGVLNYVFQALGFTSRNIGFFEESAYALPAAMIINIWKGFPFVAIMLMAGLQSIPTELYEAAKVDGASAVQRFRKITLPMLRPVSSVVFLLLVIWTIKDFSIVYNLAYGGPSHATEVLTVYLYRLAFKYFDLGTAAAGGILMLLFTMVFVIVYMRSLKGGEVN